VSGYDSIKLELIKRRIKMGYIEELRKEVGNRPLIVPGVAVVIVNSQQEILLQMRQDTRSWGFPGGFMELGESLEETAKREIKEETGLTIENLRLFNVFSSKEPHTFPNGDVVYPVTVAYIALDFSGELRADKRESVEVAFFKMDELPENMSENIKRLVKQYSNIITNIVK
jgi:ADP-ribose pyrophosphatase YjhB (NUDIX family)